MSDPGKGPRFTQRHRAAVILMLAGLALGLIGCGETDGSDTGDQLTEDPSPELTPPIEPTEPTTDEREGTTSVSVFFANEDRGDPCGEVFAVTRQVSAEDPIGEALVALLAGPTSTEAADGYGGWFSSDTAGMLNGYRAEEGVFYIDFDDFSGVIPNASSSCGSAGLLAQLDETLGQFDGVEEPRYSFDGDVAAFYEWLQLDAP